jgi:XTP/dITP diphosphohydrolase
VSSALRFLSSNPFKIREAENILGAQGISVIPIRHKVEELQTTDVESLVRDKAIKAFGYLRRPLFVEHTGLGLDYLNGFPAGLTQIFWDSLQAERFAQLFGNATPNTLTASTVIAYIDGRQCHVFEGRVHGTVPPEPKGNRDFQWDCVFVPQGYRETFSEMGDAKNEISMRRIAFDKFAKFVSDRGAQ